MSVGQEIIGSAVTAVAVAGVVLNNRRNRICFLLWMASNVASAGLHVAAGLWALAARDVAFLGLAVHGWILWGRERPRRKEPPR